VSDPTRGDTRFVSARRARFALRSDELFEFKGEGDALFCDDDIGPNRELPDAVVARFLPYINQAKTWFMPTKNQVVAW
jgi:hypothetical protein